MLGRGASGRRRRKGGVIWLTVWRYGQLGAAPWLVAELVDTWKAKAPVDSLRK